MILPEAALTVSPPRRGALPPFRQSSRARQRASPCRPPDHEAGLRRRSRRSNAALSQRDLLMAMGVAFDRHGDWQRCDVARIRKDVDAERRGIAAVALGADAETVSPVE